MEKEIDRLIDSQDNVYVLSRPKCAPRAVCLPQRQPHGWCRSNEAPLRGCSPGSCCLPPLLACERQGAAWESVNDLPCHQG